MNATTHTATRSEKGAGSSALQGACESNEGSTPSVASKGSNDKETEMQITHIVKSGDKYQINGRGPWRGAYKTDCAVTTGTECRLVTEDGELLGTWKQTTTGHEIVSN